MKKYASKVITLVIVVVGSFLVVDCGWGLAAGVWFQDVVLTSSVKNPKPIPAFTIPAKTPGTSYLQFLLMGDPGTGRSGQRDVALAMGKIAAQDSISCALVLGDNFYPSGVKSVTDEQWEEKFERMYSAPSLQVPFYAVLGNHDYYSNPLAQVEYTKVSKRWRMPSSYYAFTQNIDDTTSVEFFCLDTTPLDADRAEEKEEGQDIDAVRDSLQLGWLEQKLQQSTARWKIVAGHHALYSGGIHGDNTGLIALLEPDFLKYKVDVYLAAHDHHLEMKKPIKGILHVVSGAGGTHRSVTWKDDALYAATNMGFNRIRISAAEIVIEFYDKDGNLKYAYVANKGHYGS